MIQKSSPDWPPLKQHLEEQIQASLDALAEIGIDQERSNVLRGRIGAYRELIANVDPPPPPATPPSQTKPSRHAATGY